MNWNPTEWLSDDGRFEITKNRDGSFSVQKLKTFKETKALVERTHLGVEMTFDRATKLAEKAK